MTGIKGLKSVLLCAFFSVILFAGGFCCKAEEAQGQKNATVVDEAAVLMEEEADWLKSIAETLSDKSGWSVVVATCKDAGGKSAQTVCEEFFNQYTAGENGIGCLADLDNRELYLATAGTAQQYLTDERLDQILEEAHAAAEEADYAQALYLMLYGADQNFTKGIPEGVTPEKKDSGWMGNVINLAVLVLAAGGSFVLGKMVRSRSSIGRQRYRRPPNHTAKGGRRPAGKSSVHTGAGGRRFGGRGKKF